MKPYLLRNDNIQHQERLALERWYKKKRGRTVPYSEILHELQHEKALHIVKPKPLPNEREEA